MIKTLRGQEVEFNDNVYFSDRTLVSTITKADKPFKREEVKSKFVNCDPWYRHWYYITQPKQEEICC
jgi:hypothetical protein